MPQDPQVAFRCSREFLKQFKLAATDRETTAQAVLEEFAKAWLEDAEALTRAVSGKGTIQTNGKTIPRRGQHFKEWHEMLDNLAENRNGDYEKDAISMLKGVFNMLERAAPADTESPAESLSPSGRTSL